MSTDERTPWTRRDFLHSTLVLASAAASAPAFLTRSASALPKPGPELASLPGVDEGRILVVVQLSGGNDGLNTVVPFGSDDYYRLRPAINVPAARSLSLEGSGAYTNGVGLHPALAGVKDLYDDGLCALVQGVGYPNPNRSHFKSMDIWHTGELTGTGDGWLGRYVDSECIGFGKTESGRPTPTPTLSTSPTAAPARPMDPPIAIGRETPLALVGRRLKPVAFETPDHFRWTGADVDPALVAPYRALAARGPADDHDEHSTAAFLLRTAMDAQVSSDRIRKAVGLEPLVEYPRSDLAGQLRMVASMIRAELPTRVYYVSMGGFDTHAGQGGENGRHARLLEQFAAAVRAFYRDLKAQGNDGRVLTMSFSEFGRRVGQNASGGTDHGTAAPVFLFGPMVRPGVHSAHPSLTDLDDGDLRFNTDFRSVYADILEHWLKTDSGAVLEGRFRPTSVIRA